MPELTDISALPPIPWKDHSPTALDYRSVPVDFADPRFVEPLVDVADYGIAGEGYYARTDGLNAPYYRSFPSAPHKIWCRGTVAGHLVRVNAALEPCGVELYALDGFRPVAVQEELWAFFLAQAKTALDRPSAKACEEFAGTYCSDPRNYDPEDSRKWPVHVTGGAVDVTLRCVGSREPLYMGGIFDDPSDVSHTAHFERKLEKLDGKAHALSASDAAALHNRRLLYWAMSGAGFVNYPYEWWHFDLGTQLWVLDGGTDNAGKTERMAWYGPTAIPI
ncbi:MAG: hypothetical protein MPJ78_04685 [Hyphomicrobiaceae bacterium]|nr:hypothetical protein [Hyphomicrobiaceae bacterium]